MNTKIAIDGTILSPDGSGLSRYTSELIKEFMRRDGDFVSYATMPEISSLYGERIRLAPSTLSKYGFKGNLARLLWHQTSLPLALKKEKAKLFYSPLPEGMLFPVCKQIITIADLIPMIYPEFSPRIAQYYRWVLPRLIQVSDAIIVISESTKRDVIKHLQTGDTPIHVVYPGYGEEVFKPSNPQLVTSTMGKYGLQNYVLTVGETRPYKNVKRLIEAFAKVPIPDLKLAIVGKLSRLGQEITELPRLLGIADKVKFLGYVPDADLIALYGGAKVFAFPSYYEGFGLPPLEALACGSPVVVSSAASLPEVCGEAAVYVDPFDVDSIAEGIYKVAADEGLQENLRAKGFSQASKFSYQKSVDQLLEIFQNYY